MEWVFNHEPYTHRIQKLFFCIYLQTCFKGISLMGGDKSFWNKYTMKPAEEIYLINYQGLRIQLSQYVACSLRQWLDTFPELFVSYHMRWFG